MPSRGPASGSSRSAGSFLEACRTGDVEGLLDTLAPDLVLTSDGGGNVSAARRPILGAAAALGCLDLADDA